MKNVWITGASRGIGYSTAQLFLEMGHRVIILTRNTQALEALSILYPETLEICKTNLMALEQSNYPDLSVDILINNAGTLVNKPFVDISKDDLIKVFGTNVFGPIQLIQDLMPQFSSDAHIVNISSVGGITGSVKFPGLSAYSSSKGALTILTECLQAEFGDSTSWSFNCLALGAVQTEMLEEAFPGYVAPIDAASMAAYICGFALNNHRVMRGRVVEVAMSTPK
ncbi:MAG TPA: short-chain dehydrogenase [Cryomorphaceae bacterium]|nr:short-chain dehydrogenase [Cryomorphaceae bacterium]